MIKYLFVYRYALLAAALSWIALFVMQQFPNGIVFLSALGIWGICTVLVLMYIDRQLGQHKQYLPLLFALIIAFTGLTSLIELAPLRFALNIAAGCAIGALFVAALQEVHAIRFHKKRWRRIMVIFWTFAIYAIMTTLYALGLFFPNIPKSLFILAMSCLSTYAAYTIWYMYDNNVTRKTLLWTLLLGLVVLELVWVSFALPFGYLAKGILVVWVWYILQLLIRFHLSPQDILWKKQWTFLGLNGILYILILFTFIRWI